MKQSDAVPELDYIQNHLTSALFMLVKLRGPGAPPRPPGLDGRKIALAATEAENALLWLNSAIADYNAEEFKS